MDRTVWWIAVGLLALVGLAGPVASAQQQTVNVQLQATWVETPDELPGVYHAGLVAETQASGGHCLCQQTHVDLQAAQTPSAVDAVVFSPSAYVVDWTSRDNQPGEPHGQDARVAIGVSEVPQDVSMLALTLTADVDSSGQLVHDEVQPTQLALPIPSENATASDDEASASSQDGGSGDGADQPASAEEPTAGVSSVETSPSEDGVDALTLGTGAGMAGLALSGVALHRYRDGDDQP